MNNKIPKTFCLIVIVGFCLFCSGCVDDLARDKAQKEILQILPRYLGPAKSYTVDVDGTAAQMMDGKVRRIKIIGIEVQSQDLPRLERLEAVIVNLKIDAHNKVIESCDSASWTGWISPKELTRISQGKVKYLSDIRIGLKNKRILVTGSVAWNGIKATGAIEAVPSVRSGDEIWLTPIRFSAHGLGFGLPEWGRKKADHFINPVYKIPENPLSLTIAKIDVEPNAVRAAGSFNPAGIGGNGRVQR